MYLLHLCFNAARFPKPELTLWTANQPKLLIKRGHSYKCKLRKFTCVGLVVRICYYFRNARLPRYILFDTNCIQTESSVIELNSYVVRSLTLEGVVRRCVWNPGTTDYNEHSLMVSSAVFSMQNGLPGSFMEWISFK